MSTETLSRPDVPLAALNATDPFTRGVEARSCRAQVDTAEGNMTGTPSQNTCEHQLLKSGFVSQPVLFCCGREAVSFVVQWEKRV